MPLGSLTDLDGLEERARLAIAEGRRLLWEVTKLRMSKLTSNGVPSTRPSTGSTCVNTCVGDEHAESQKGKSRRTAKGVSGQKDQGTIEGVEDSPRGGVLPSQKGGTYKYRNPDKWRAYMRVYMQRRRAKPK